MSACRPHVATRHSDTCKPINIPLQLSADGAPAAYLPGAGGDNVNHGEVKLGDNHCDSQTMRHPGPGHWSPGPLPAPPPPRWSRASGSAGSSATASPPSALQKCTYLNIYRLFKSAHLRTVTMINYSILLLPQQYHPALPTPDTALTPWWREH